MQCVILISGNNATYYLRRSIMKNFSNKSVLKKITVIVTFISYFAQANAAVSVNYELLSERALSVDMNQDVLEVSTTVFEGLTKQEISELVKSLKRSATSTTIQHAQLLVSKLNANQHIPYHVALMESQAGVQFAGPESIVLAYVILVLGIIYLSSKNNEKK